MIPGRTAPRLLALALAAAVAVSGCAGSEGPDPHPAVEPGKGLVFFYRGMAERGIKVPFAVKEDGVQIGTLEPATYFYRQADPGRHYYEVEPLGPQGSDREAGTFVDVDAGERHYVEAVTLEGTYPVRARVFNRFPDPARSALEPLEVVAPRPGEGAQ